MTTAFTPTLNIRRMHDHFNSPVTTVDCGKMCAPHNPNGKPFCCDICHAVPAAYRIEWHYLQSSTDLWHVWRGDECLQETSDPQVLLAETPAHMLLLACKGPAQCQRPYRAMSCRQFPFFPYITAGDRFIGLAYEWACEPTCWVISHLEKVTPVYRHRQLRPSAGSLARRVRGLCLQARTDARAFRQPKKTYSPPAPQRQRIPAESEK
jgi:hypothetical protein